VPTGAGTVGKAVITGSGAVGSDVITGMGTVGTLVGAGTGGKGDVGSGLSVAVGCTTGVPKCVLDVGVACAGRGVACGGGPGGVLEWPRNIATTSTTSSPNTTAMPYTPLRLSSTSFTYGSFGLLSL
jgi:hypothetical protein